MISPDGDPDFVPESGSRGSSPARSEASRSGTPFLRSSCHHLGPCHEGHGIEFHTRITPSPARSYHRRSRSRRNSRFSTDSPNLAAQNLTEPETADPGNSIVRKNLSSQFKLASVEYPNVFKTDRTRRWVEQQTTVTSRTTTVRTELGDTNISQRAADVTAASHERHTSLERTMASANDIANLITPPRTVGTVWDTSSIKKGSPRLKAFEGRAWVRSPRTGYTYVDGPTYRNTWTPEREIPMPHMARLPIDAYNDGEVSFSLSPSIKRRLVYTSIREEFSDDEHDDVSGEADTGAERDVGKSIVGKIFGLLLSLLLFPYVLVSRFSAKAFQTFKCFGIKASQNWRNVRAECTSFMSTNVAPSELFTDDEDDDGTAGMRRDNRASQFPGSDRQSSFYRKVVQSCSNSLVFVKSFVPKLASSSDEESWIEEVIIRRFIRIFRFFSSTVYGRARTEPAPVAPPPAPPATSEARANDRLPISVVASSSAPDNYNESPSFENQNISLAKVDETMSVQGEANLSSQQQNGSHENGVGRSLFKPLAWVVSCLALPRFPSRRRRLLRRRRQFGPPTRCSLRLKGLPAENFGDLPKTKRRFVRRRRANVSGTEETVVEEHFEEEAGEEQTETQLERLICAILDYFGYFEEEADIFDGEEDEEHPESEVDHENVEPIVVRIFGKVLRLFSNVFVAIFTALTFPFRFRLPSLPSRRRPRRDSKHFRAGTRSSLRLKGLPAETSDLVGRKRCYRKRRQVADETVFSDDEEFDDVYDGFNLEPEPVLQRCLNWILDRLGYFQDFDDNDYVENDEQLDVGGADAVSDRQVSGRLFNLVRSAILWPFKFILSPFAFFPSRNFQLKRSNSGNYYTAAGEHREGEVLGATTVFFYSVLNKVGYFKQLEVDGHHVEANANLSTGALLPNLSTGALLSAVFWPLLSLFTLAKTTLVGLSSSLRLPSRSLHLRKSNGGKYYQVRELNPDAVEMTETEEVGGVKVAFFSILNKFGYFENLIGEEGGREAEPAGSSAGWLVTVVGAMLSPILLTFFVLKSIFSTLSSSLTLPPRDFQWKKNEQGKFFRVGSRQSKRLRGIRPDNASLPETARRGRSRRGQSDLSDSEAFEVEAEEEEEIVGVFRTTIIRILNTFGYFHQLNADDGDSALIQNPPDSKYSSLFALLTSPVSSVISFVAALKSKYFGSSTVDETSEQMTSQGSSSGPPRQQRMGPAFGDAAYSDQGHAVVSSWRMYFFGSAKTIGQSDSESEDENFDVAQVQKTNFNLSLGTILAWPFLFGWKFVLNVARRLWSLLTTSKGQNDVTTREHRLDRKGRRPSTKKNLQREPDISEDEDDRTDQNRSRFFQRVSAFFSGGSGRQTKTDEPRMKSYIRIPSDSFVEGEMEHETSGNGNFTRTRFRQHESSVKRSKLLCCIFPLCLLLLPLLIFAACQFQPEYEVCQNLDEFSSQIYTGAYSGVVHLGNVLSSYDNFVKSLQDGMSLVTATGEKSFTALSWLFYPIAETLTDVSKNTFFFCQDSAVTIAESFSASLVGFKNSVSGLVRSEESAENETSKTAAGNIFHDYVHTLLFGGFQLLCDIFASALQFFTLMWSWVWSVFVHVSFWIISAAQWFMFASPSGVSDPVPGSMSVVQPLSDEIVRSILESPQLRDYISQKNAEHFEAEQRHLDEVYLNLIDKFGNEESSSNVLAMENELNMLRQNIFERIQVLALDQAEMATRLKDQENRHLGTAEIDMLSRKFDQLKAEIAKSGQEASARESSSDARDREIELKLTELQLKIDNLESELEALRVEAKKCCKNETFIRELVTSHLQKWVKEDFGRWNESMLLLKKDLEETLRKVGDDLLNDILSTASVKLKKIAESEAEKTVEFILADVVKKIATKNVTTSGSHSDDVPTNLIAKEEIEKMVRNALTTYDADKTGLFDFALETAGGSVVSTRCTETYVRTGASYTFFGIPIWWPSNNPRTAIQPGVHPGECWAFKGSQGYLVIELSTPMRPTRFSIEHIPKSMSPNGSIDSAPKDFVVYGLEMSEQDPNPVLLGQFEYDDNGEPIQMFDSAVTDKIFKYIELNIVSNHGNVNYTCLYRFRVHGNH